jgi:hypothetical protein
LGTREFAVVVDPETDRVTFIPLVPINSIQGLQRAAWAGFGGRVALWARIAYRFLLFISAFLTDCERFKIAPRWSCGETEMARPDLHKLSAPVEALRPALDEAYKRLDAQWDEVARCFKELPIPTTVSYTFEPEDEHSNFACLVWQKWNGKKRLCIESNYFNPSSNPYSDYEVTTIPFEEWSGQQRVDMLEHLPGLFAAAARATEEFIEKTKN